MEQTCNMLRVAVRRKPTENYLQMLQIYWPLQILSAFFWFIVLCILATSSTFKPFPGVEYPTSVAPSIPSSDGI